MASLIPTDVQRPLLRLADGPISTRTIREHRHGTCLGNCRENDFIPSPRTADKTPGFCPGVLSILKHLHVHEDVDQFAGLLEACGSSHDSQRSEPSEMAGLEPYGNMK